ncbi:hypothetical protein P8452_66148 [Trifolium repens]|nr:hypothetical protein P8452_66148 [Trifolium repens]
MPLFIADFASLSWTSFFHLETKDKKAAFSSLCISKDAAAIRNCVVLQISAPPSKTCSGSKGRKQRE